MSGALNSPSPIRRALVHSDILGWGFPEFLVQHALSVIFMSLVIIAFSVARCLCWWPCLNLPLTQVSRTLLVSLLQIATCRFFNERSVMTGFVSHSAEAKHSSIPCLLVFAFDAVLAGSPMQCFIGIGVLALAWSDFHVERRLCRISSAFLAWSLLIGSPVELVVAVAFSFVDPAFPRRAAAKPSPRHRVAAKHKKKRALLKSLRAAVPPTELADDTEVGRVMQARLALPVSKTQCRARTFRLFQCSRRHTQEVHGVLVCRVHARGFVRHGVVGAQLAVHHLREFRAYLARALRQPNVTWYSRDALWQEAERQDLSGVAAFSDEAYNEALHAIHLYYRMHPGARHSRQLEQFAGPLHARERGTSKEDYLGPAASLYRFYAYPVFCYVLRRIDAALRPETANERQFMAALVDTNVRLQRWSLFRTFGSDCWYRGPQSFVHRADTSRMTFSPHELLAQAERPPAPGVSDGDAWLCCAACQEWRRVDFQSSRVFSTDVYFIRAVHLRLEVMRSQAPRMWQAVHQAASAAKANGERLQVAIYDTTLLQVQATCPTMAGLIDLNRYILDAIGHAALAEGVALADNLAALDIESWNTFCGPKFVCSNLVGVTCDTPTDMEQAVAAAVAYSFEACVVREPVLVDGRQSSVASTPIHAFFVELSEAHADATDAAQRTCQVHGCTNHYEKRYPSGRSVRVVPPGGDNLKDAYTISRLCKNHYARLQRRKGTKGRVNQRDVMPPEHSFWTDAEIESQPGIRQRQLRLPQTAAPLLHLRCNDVRLPSIQDLCYRASGDGRWVLHNPTAAVSAAFPPTADIYPESFIPLHSGKSSLPLHEHLLRRVHEVHKILGNLVLFKCTLCKERFPAFHPCHEPTPAPRMLASCRNAVATWQEKPVPSRQLLASVYKGTCKRCADDLAGVADNEQLRGVAVFGQANMMDLLHGYPDVDAFDPLLTVDHVRLLNLLRYYTDHATVVEEMLVALLHMQIDVCHFRQGRKKRYEGLARFRKNIIAFPQELQEVKQMFHFLTNLNIGDLVNVALPDKDRGEVIFAARIEDFTDDGFQIRIASEPEPRQVSFVQVRQRIRLPWRPVDLRNNLIILRRRNGDKDEYVEDLRVRRHFVQGILEILTKLGDWRPDRGCEPLHMFYTDFDIMPDHEFEEVLPLDGVPAGLNFQSVDDPDHTTLVTRMEFQDWLTEGRQNCDMAQALLSFWVHTMRGNDCETVVDFFDLLLADYLEADAAAEGTMQALPLAYLASFVSDNCAILRDLPDHSLDARRDEVLALIADELASVQAYLTVWRGCGALEQQPPRDVAQDLRAQTAQRVLGWPEIGKTPVTENCDGRLVKAHPLTFPTGCGDLRQTRLRTDFHPLAWVQHVFRYFDGRVLNTMRGQRAVWAVFNTAMRDLARRAGSLVHKNSCTSALTKAELRELTKQQAPLVATLAAFGVDMPATAMQSKRSRHEVEWIVRQMSWSPPWTVEGQQLRERAVLKRFVRGTTKKPEARQSAAAPAACRRAELEQRWPLADHPDVHLADGASDFASEASWTPTGDNVDDAYTGDDMAAEDASEHEGTPVLRGRRSRRLPDDTDEDEPMPSADPAETLATLQEAGALASVHSLLISDDELAVPLSAAAVWRSLPNVSITDRFGYGRTPGFWFTLNFPFNHVHEVHRFHKATADIVQRLAPMEEVATSTSGLLDVNRRCLWVRSNPDLVCFIHALRVELIVTYVMCDIVPPDAAKPFHYWLAFEWGTSGNPHAHGKAYVANNPSFENVVQDEETREQLIQAGHADAFKLRTKEAAELELGNFFDPYVKEWHPSEDDRGKDLYPFVLELLQGAAADVPQCTDLLGLLDDIFSDDTAEPDLTPVHQLLLGLIESGQRHTGHGHRKVPEYGVDPCARKGSTSEGKQYVYCRYLFPRLLRLFEGFKRAVVEDDPHRPGLRNLYMARNDSLINPFELHLLLCNLGNIDWRALLNLWAVLEYLTKYATKLGTGTSSLQKTFAHVGQIVEDFETEDGLRDLWRTAVMKFYSRAIGGRDFSLLETVHYGLRLPNTLSNFGPVRTVSLSGWTTVRSRRDLQLQAPTGRATYLNKIELFNARGQLKRPRSFDVRDLEGISLYAFWRLFDVQGNRLVRKRAEQFVAVSGLGWPAHAKQDHPSHDEYARRTLLCYMPCLGLRGTDWIGEKIAAEFRGQWKSALYHFVMDAQNEWCPTWIVRNYEALNDVIQGLPALSSTPLLVPDDVEQPSSESLESIRKLPHAELFKSKFLFEECGEPGPIEDACGYEQAAIEDSWSKAERPAWQLHSALGPNIKPTQLSMRVAPLQEIVNPLHYDYTTNVFDVQPHAVNAFWEQVARTSSRYDDPSLHRELLRDDDQQLFVDLMLRHVKAVISFTLHTGPWVPPLRVLLLGGPGTGKTKTLQTALQEIYRLLDAVGLPVDFIRCAAPTGCAAFNMKFNATTIHRLISLFPHQAWSELSDERLAHLQAYLASTRFLVIDEVSMLGRQFMGKVDSRCCQAKAITNVLHGSLGGMSCALVGDPAQIEAINDQQCYDRTAHKETVRGSRAAHVQLSNRGLDVYAEFDTVVILSKVHRLQQHAEADTSEKQIFNDKSTRFLCILHALRNAALTHDDYFWLCRLKRCHASASRRASFANAPVLMEFRRTTEQNEEHNCEHYNRQRLRVMANTSGVPVFAFDALHDGKPHADAMHIDDGSFAGLQKHLEIAEGALVILTHNLAVELGLINGSQGKIVCVIFSPGRQPNHQDERCRMPWVILVDFPCYSGPPFLTCAHQHHWVPVLARSARCDEDRAITRTQFPLCLAYALTPWKAQGMTLAQVIVKLRTAGAKPGVLLVALSRVRHPDDILLEDDFPSYTQILSQSKSANFQARQQWEKIALVKFARTIRKHMRDPDVFSADVVWTSEDARIATALLSQCAEAPEAKDHDILFHTGERDASITFAAAVQVWQRLQLYPHVFSVRHARGKLSQTTMSGEISTTTASANAAPFGDFHRSEPALQKFSHRFGGLVSTSAQVQQMDSSRSPIQDVPIAVCPSATADPPAPLPKRSRCALSDEALPCALRATTQAQTLEVVSSDILQVSCRGFFYGAHKAITGLPQPWQIHLTDANVFR